MQRNGRCRQRISLSLFQVSLPWSSQINDLEIDTCRLIARPLAIFGQGKDRLAQCHDNVTESWRRWPGLPVAQHYKLSISVYCHKSAPFII